jgi:hypothetical protein
VANTAAKRAASALSRTYHANILTNLQPLMVIPLPPQRLAASAGFIEKSRGLFRLIDEVAEQRD